MNNFQEELVIENDKLVHYFVRKLKVNDMKNYEYDDLVQIGRIGLIKAAKTYNGSVKFTTYASRCINNEILMFMRKENKNSCQISLDEPIAIDFDGHECVLGETIEAQNSDFSNLIGDIFDLEKLFNVVLNTFDTREILIWLYIILGENQEKLANKFNISQSYVSRLKDKIYSKVNKILNQNNDFEEKYIIKIQNNKCIFSFEIADISMSELLAVDLLNKFQNTSKFIITKNLGNISISFLSIEEAIPVIVFVVSIIDKHSINLVKKKEMKQDSNVRSTQKKEKLTKTLEVRNYMKSLRTFTPKQIHKHFPNITSAIINGAIAYSKSVGEISSIRRGVYVSNKI